MLFILALYVHWFFTNAAGCHISVYKVKKFSETCQDQTEKKRHYAFRAGAGRRDIFYTWSVYVKLQQASI